MIIFKWLDRDILIVFSGCAQYIILIQLYNPYAVTSLLNNSKARYSKRYQIASPAAMTPGIKNILERIKLIAHTIHQPSILNNKTVIPARK